MAYAVGIVLALGLAVFAHAIGLDRGRAFYATVAMVVATYYVLFAVMGASLPVLVIESLVMVGFVVAAALGFRRSAWLIAGCLAAHGAFDALHGFLYANPGMPEWWPAFCGSYDVAAAVFMLWFAPRRAAAAAPAVAAGGAR
jgi:hypothetical protein